MLQDDQEYETTLARIAQFQRQAARIRQTEKNIANYRLSVGGYLAELDRMNLQVREYLWFHPFEAVGETQAQVE